MIDSRAGQILYQPVTGQTEPDVSLLRSILKELSQLPQLQAPPYSETDLGLIEHYVDVLRSYDQIIVIGVGGSITTPKAVVSLLRNTLPAGWHQINTMPQITFLSRIDLAILDQVIAAAAGQKVALLSISKSGLTLETLEICRYLAEKITPSPAVYHLGCRIHNQPDDAIKQAPGCHQELIDYPEKISGRFSVFCTPSLLLAKVIGADISGFCQGGKQAVFDYLLESEGGESGGEESGRDSRDAGTFLRSISLIRAAARDGFCNINLSLSDNLFAFGQWLDILLVESLGKGRSKINSCSFDLSHACHSYMQAYCEGKSPVILHLWLENNPGHHPDERLTKLQNSMLDKALAVIVEHQVPHLVRTVRLDDAESIGYLFMSKIIETIAVAAMLEIDPCSQKTIDKMKHDLYKSL